MMNNLMISDLSLTARLPYNAVAKLCLPILHRNSPVSVDVTETFLFMQLDA